MKIVAIFSMLGLALSDMCPQDKEVECITDVNHAFDLCDKAARSKGKDQSADI